MDPAVVALLSIVGTLVVAGLAFFLWTGGNFGRLGLARRVLRDEALAGRVEEIVNPPPPKPLPPPKPSGAPVRFLALLQREGRLLDFLLEDIQTYPDAQIGAAVRDIHRQCQAALKEHLVLEPVLPQGEGTQVEVAAGFDPSAVRLTGNVTGQPPFRGTLQHHGWRVKEIKLAPPPEGQDEFVLMPAEVELP
jgi:hypothetical protein